MANFHNASARKPNIIMDASEFYNAPEWGRDAFKEHMQSAEDRRFQQMADSGLLSSYRPILDIGSRSTGSAFINRVARENKGITPIYIDLYPGKRMSKRVKRGFCQADANSLPFHDNKFDLAYARGIIPRGIRDRSGSHFQVNPCKLAEEAYRVLRPGGGFVFHVCDEMNLRATSRSLKRIGFTRLEHMIRRAYQDRGDDEYIAFKPKNH